MRSEISRATLLVGCLIVFGLAFIGSATAGPPEGQSEDQKYAGTWVGTYTLDNGYENKLSCMLSKDEKGQWRGTITFTNRAGEQTNEFKSVQIADGKLKAKLESPNGQAEVTFEGAFQGDGLAGTYAAGPKGSTDVVEKGTWKVTKSATPKK